jgi:hypothetical protein
LAHKKATEGSPKEVSNTMFNHSVRKKVFTSLRVLQTSQTKKYTIVKGKKEKSHKPCKKLLAGSL